MTVTFTVLATHADQINSFHSSVPSKCFSVEMSLSLALQQCREPKRGLAFLASPRHSQQLSVLNFPHESGSVSGGQSQPNPSCSRLKPLTTLPITSTYPRSDQIRSRIPQLHTYYISTIRTAKLLTIETTHENRIRNTPNYS